MYIYIFFLEYRMYTPYRSGDQDNDIVPDYENIVSIEVEKIHNFKWQIRYILHQK